MSAAPTAAARLRATWNRLSPRPGGKWLFSKIFGTLIPYSGSVRPQILELGPGFARVAMADRRAVRNHLASVHAIALTNLAEMTTGLAMTFGLPDSARAILTQISIDYLKKARGTLVCECRCDPPSTDARTEFDVISEIRDAEGVVVARARARWLIGSYGSGAVSR
ncbi:MAG: hotdog fold domain-containing protein [Thermoanaerobaculia bacterium]